MIVAPQLFRTLAIVLLMVVSIAISLVGCTVTSPNPAAVRAIQAHEVELTIPVIRYGRYTLVELDPTDSQRNLLEHVIHLNVPASANATVGDALGLLLAQSGFRLCENNDETQALSALPLPASHFQLGPLTLRTALEVIAGPAWDLQVDAVVRKVCFKPASAAMRREP